jgi:hypothetical protein
MEWLPFQPVLDGRFEALGDAFHPIPDEMLDGLRPRLVAPQAVVEPLGAAGTWQLTMEIPVAVMVYLVSADGRRYVSAKMPGGSVKTPRSTDVNAPTADLLTYVLVEATSGAFIAGINAQVGDTVTIGPDSLRPVNSPGLPSGPGELPTPSNSGSPLPADSPPVLVAAGVVGANGNILARTQHWQKSDDSYSLPGCSSLTVSFTQSSGITQSSSTMEQLSTQVGFSATVGWGPISSSISASMSQSSSSTQDVSVSETSEATVIREFNNRTTVPMVVYQWQLVDRILVIDSSYSLIGMIENIVEPAVPMAYDAKGNPFPPTAPRCPKPKDPP